MGQSGRSLRESSRKKDLGGNDDVKKQVDSDNSHQKPIYQLVNVKNGGGKLVDIIKSRVKNSSASLDLTRRSHDFKSTSNGHKQQATSTSHLDDEIDKQIRELVEPLLYEKGRGKLVPLSEIWRWRFGQVTDASSTSGKEKTPTSRFSSDPTGLESGNKSSSLQLEGKIGPSKRWVCWRLEERGFVGETALHICFLLSTQTHMIIAQKLLSMFPMLINDIFTSEEYFGESSLHMAIVNEDIRIVKLLLSHGANVHDRCLGSFFMPIDQKEKANILIRRQLEEDPSLQVNSNANTNFDLDLDLQSNHYEKNTITNYEGYAYWGEYPLSFAACLGLTDCYRLLLAKGANPNFQDSNGNGTLHMTIIANNRSMFDLCYSTGANLNIANKQQLTPLTLAAKLKRVELFFHILNITRQVDWIFCNVGFVKFPLDGLDSVNTSDGSCSDDSVLSIVVFGVSVFVLLFDSFLLIRFII